MKVPLKWVRQYTDIKISNEELISSIFTNLGAVEHIENLEEKYKDIIIAKIKKAQNHPDSEKLGVYILDTGSSEVQVVAGDRDLKEGNLVAYFPLDSKVVFNPHPDKWNGVIKKVKLAGIESEGMMASQRELDLGADHSKVMVIEGDFKAGTSFSKAFDLDDIVVDIENKALTNRGDCFGILGIAREISAMQKFPFTSPAWYTSTQKPKGSKTVQLNVINSAQVNCPRYMGVVIDNIKIQQSPIWMRMALIKNGIKPINNIVDITNYMMVLSSQPMHAFDFDKVIAKDPTGKAHIVVRQAKTGETLMGINDKLLELDETMTVIADSQNPIAIGGIIGGKDTEVDENTQRIILECANFNRYNIRKTSWKLGISTDAATRYTKALDPNQCEPVMYETIRLIEELASGKIVSEISDDYQMPIGERIIELEISDINERLGLNLTNEEIKDILEGVEYKLENTSKGFSVIVPTFRQDIQIKEDIYEDIARIYGYNNISVTLPSKTISPVKDNKAVELKDEIRDILSSEGLSEILTYNFVGQDLFEKSKLDINKAFHIKNALSPDLEYMRTSLLPSILQKTNENMSRGYTDVHLFEINIAHNKDEEDFEKLPLERWFLSGVVSQKDTVSYSPYYCSKVYVDVIEKKLNLKSLSYEIVKDISQKDIPVWIAHRLPMFNPNSSAVISFELESKKYYLGILGEISSTVKVAFNLPECTSIFEIDIDGLDKAKSSLSKYIEPSKFPKITQDLCFVLDKDIPYKSVKDDILNILKSSKMYYELEPVDIYSPKEKSEIKQITFRISLQSWEKTLENKEFEKTKKKIEYILKEKYKAELI